MTTRQYRSGRSAFTALVGIICLLVAGYLFVWPFIQGFIIVQSWQKIPCQIPPGNPKIRYFFTYKDVNYYSPRFNLWQVQFMVPVPTPRDAPTREPNAFCYVREDSAGKVAMAVLDPKAGPDTGVLLNRGAILSLLVGTAGFLAYKSRRAHRAPSVAPPAAGSLT
jgi:hypothetical protein